MSILAIVFLDVNEIKFSPLTEETKAEAFWPDVPALLNTTLAPTLNDFGESTTVTEFIEPEVTSSIVDTTPPPLNFSWEVLSLLAFCGKSSWEMKLL